MQSPLNLNWLGMELVLLWNILELFKMEGSGTQVVYDHTLISFLVPVASKFIRANFHGWPARTQKISGIGIANHVNLTMQAERQH